MRGQHATHVLSPAGCGLRSRVTVLNGVARGPKPGGCSFHPPAPKHCIDHNRRPERVWCPSPSVCITTTCIANTEKIAQFCSDDFRTPRRLDRAAASPAQPTRMRFRARATVPDDTQCVAGISPLAAGPASNGPVDRSRQLQPSQPAAANQQQRSFSWRAIFGNFQTWQLVVPKTYYLNKY